LLPCHQALLAWNESPKHDGCSVTGTNSPSESNPLTDLAVSASHVTGSCCIAGEEIRHPTVAFLNPFSWGCACVVVPFRQSQGVVSKHKQRHTSSLAKKKKSWENISFFSRCMHRLKLLMFACKA